ncbi:MAG: D-alanine--D-alanine ligase [Candidatus Limnocylindrales bacterium]
MSQVRAGASAAAAGMDAVRLDPGTPVAVLLGGPSAEHDVSLVSGRAIAAAMAGRGHPVEAWLIDLGGGWWRLPEAAHDPKLAPVAYDDPAAMGGEGPLDASAALARLARRDPAPVVWIALHGPFGEDGTVQALCEAAGLVYTGSGVAASALGMDKVLFKRLARSLEMPVVPFETLARTDYDNDPQAALARLVAFAGRLPDRRLMIKPARLGSSVGTSIVHRPDEPPYLEAALAEAFRWDDLVLAEAYLAAPRELEVSVLGNATRTVAFGPGEVVPGHEFYDYEAKYAAGLSRTIARPEIGPAVAERVRELARAAFSAIGASGFGRVDFLVHGGRIYLSEINTIPGFTPISLFPILCHEGGLDFAALSARIVELAIERFAARPPTGLTRADLP